jgi:hypothetical protein
MTAPVLVRETRRDGGVWNFWYPDRRSAERDLSLLREAHQGRTYELVTAASGDVS